jgi:hypothetical protein
MVTTGYGNFGEEWAQKLAFRSDLITRDLTVEVVLFNDAVDQTDDTSDAPDITTEPTTGNYTRQTFSLDGPDVAISSQSGDIRAEATVTFDLANTTDTVDSSAAIVDFQSDVVNSETTQNPHLLFAASLDIGSVDLSNFTSIEVTPQLDLA